MAASDSLVGSVVQGYRVKCILASGASGLLYEAIHVDSNEVAVIRRRHLDEPEAHFDIFVREATTFLPSGSGAPRAEVFVTQDGSEVLLLRRPPGSRASSKYATTEKVLPRPPVKTPAPSTAGNRRWVMLAAAALAIAFAAAGALLMQSKQSRAAKSPLPAQAALPAPAPPRLPESAPSAVELKALPAEVALPAPARQPAPPKTEAPAPAEASARHAESVKGPHAKATVVVEAPPACRFDDLFRDYAHRTTAELRSMKTATAGPAFDNAADELAQALIDRDCRRANDLLNKLRRLVGAPLD